MYVYKVKISKKKKKQRGGRSYRAETDMHSVANCLVGVIVWI